MDQTRTTLDEYRRKRDFGRTREPRGIRARSAEGSASFVVQKHAARRLHFDLRLEWRGVLLSWAVTKGPSLDPSVKRLAVRTEDHPLEYANFEGTIPDGEYGAGTVMVWDTGTWQPQESVDEGLKAGKLKFVLNGSRMKGRWTLVRMRSGEREKRENWLLIKERDDEANNRRTDLAKERDKSILTGRSMKQIASGVEASPRTSGKARKTSKPAANRNFSLPTPNFVKLELARLEEEPREGEYWLHEYKFDGYRCLAGIGKQGVRLYTRSGLDWTERYRGVPEALQLLNCKNALIDGEIVTARDANAGSHFSALRQDLKRGNPVLFYAFDLLTVDGEDLRQRPLLERKAELVHLLGGMPQGSAVRLSEHFVGDGLRVLQAVAETGGEGIVSKRMDSTYKGTRSGAWLKVKTGKRQEFVIGGFVRSSSRGRPFASLIMGTMESGRLVYRGRVGTGFDNQAMDDLAKRFKTLVRKTPPFENVPSGVSRDVVWLRPELVAEVEYAELTDDGNLRHAVFQGLRDDKEADMARLEVPAREAAGSKVVAGVTISNPQRQIFPKMELTKLALAEYYSALGDRFISHAGQRPLSLLRCTSGVKGGCFFQKHAGKGFPEQIGTVEIEESSGTMAEYMSLGSTAAAVAAVQMGTIEFHIWGARNDDLEKPDRLVFDLDPDENLPFATVIDAANEIAELLSDLGFETVPMLTGGKGIHVICPLRRSAGWETVKLFANGLAEHLARTRPDFYVATMSKAKRKGKIFIDWLRNERGSTAITPYSVRAREGAPVAVPVRWDELPSIKAANKFVTQDVIARLSEPCPLLEMPRSKAIGKSVVAKLERLVGQPVLQS